MEAVKSVVQLYGSLCIDERVSGPGSVLYMCCSNSENGETIIVCAKSQCDDHIIKHVIYIARICVFQNNCKKKCCNTRLTCTNKLIMASECQKTRY